MMGIITLRKDPLAQLRVVSNLPYVVALVIYEEHLPTAVPVTPSIPKTETFPIAEHIALSTFS